MPRTLAIGDIHGCSRALDVLLAAVSPCGADTLITLGDHVDRGPDSKGVLDRLIDLHRTGRVVPLRGNHEAMMLAARESPLGEFRWRQCGGEATLVSYCRGRIGSVADVPDRHWAFLEACAPWHECETHFFVHANALADVPLAEQPEYVLQWEPFGWPKPHRSGKVMVCGHTQQRSGVPFHLGHAVCLDTWAYGGGWLTCLDVTTGCVWQANQRGDRRTAHLDEYRIRQGTCT